MSPDPFYIKRYAKWDPRRLVPTLEGRLENRIALRRFDAYALPLKALEGLPPLPSEPNWENTALQRSDMQYLLLLCQLCEREQISGAVVEVGCFRGETTRVLAQTVHPRRMVAVDPYRGYGGGDIDYAIFCQNTRGLQVEHLRLTSGDAFRGWKKDPVALVFIDAVHDYPNTRFDIAAWGGLVAPGGFVAAHDTDNPSFAGTRRAVYEAAQNGYVLFAHPSNLTILRKRE
jgi:predicted O-methyltransferase YrrM